MTLKQQTRIYNQNKTDQVDHNRKISYVQVHVKRIYFYHATLC